MVLVSTEKVVLGSIAYVIFLVFSIFPSVHFLRMGRIAGSLLGAMLMVIFKVITPDQAYAAIDLQILGLLFGTMVVRVYLERADMFKYLGIMISWKSKGAKDLLCRVCVISAISSALFTNDTSCVVLTEFILKIARQNNIPPHPFLLALASSANIGSSATPIGNPQNLVIAVQSNISFGEFLLGMLPAVVVGVFVNALILLCMYWELLSIVKDEENALDEMRFSEADATSHRFSPATMSHGTSHRFSPATMSHVTSLNAQERNSVSEAVNVHRSPNLNGSTGPFETLTDQINLSESNAHGESSGIVESTRNSSASIEAMGDDNYLQMREENFASRRSLSGRLARMNVVEDGISLQSLEGDAGFARKWMRLLREASVYSVPSGILIGMGFNMSWIALTAALILVVLAILVLSLEEEAGIVAEGQKKMLWKTSIVTIGMLIAFLLGLDMSWTALAAALILVVIDFEDPRLCLQKVSYSLLVFFCGMFITVDGFNRTGIPSTLWNVIEPHARINHVNGIVVLAFVILILSSIASNVPTVLLLGARVAASAAAISPGEEKKAWLILAWVSTVAGNMSLLGSAANLIVCELARNSQSYGYTLSFWNHLKFGIPSTLIVTAIGLTLIRG